MAEWAMAENQTDKAAPSKQDETLAQSRLSADANLANLQAPLSSALAETNHPDHIVVVLEENHSFEQLIGNPDAEYINSLAENGRLFTNAHAVAHPSQPNYLALFSGSTQGVRDDKPHNFGDTPTLASQLADAGQSFTGFVEQSSFRKHNPWESFSNSQGVEASLSNFPSDFSNLPAVSFVSPSTANDMHDGTVAQADQWLKENLGAYADWAKTHNSQLIILTDEDEGKHQNHIPVIEYGAGINPSQNSQAINTIGVLHGIEQELGLPFLGDNSAAAKLGPG